MLSPKTYRKLIFPLVNNRFSYLGGMLIVRHCRKIRSRINSANTKSAELVEIDNYAGNIKMVVDKYSYMGGSIYWTGYHQLNECLYLRDFLKPEMTFVDAGANQGEFTLFAAKRLTNGKVIAFEPVESNLKSLRRNVEVNLFTNVTVIEKGLHEIKLELPIYTSNSKDSDGAVNEGLSTIFPDEYRSELEQTIELVSFDEYYGGKLDRFDMLKIDVEGAELFALKGMEQSIRKFHPQILIELNRETSLNAGYTVEDVIQFISGMGYQSYSIFRGRLVKKEFTAEMKYGNFIFIYNTEK